MYTSDENGGEPEVRRDFNMEAQILVGVFLMSAFAGLIWFLFAGR